MTVDERTLVLLVRHADAGARERFVGEDALRPLSKKGRRQAEAVAERLSGSTATLLSSPALRCLETLAPLSAGARRAMEPRAELAEGAPPEAALALLVERTASSGAVIACSHGDVLGGVIDLALAKGATLVGRVNLDKAATAELAVRAGQVVTVSFTQAPKG